MTRRGRGSFAPVDLTITGLATLTELARSTVSQRVTELIKHGYLTETGPGSAARHRPPGTAGPAQRRRQREHRAHRPGTRDLLLVKLGTGIGCGIIADCKPSRAGARAAVTGAGLLAIEHILDPARINDLLSRPPAAQ